MLIATQDSITYCPAMIRILVSSCLMGQKVRYNGSAKLEEHPLLMQWQDEGRLVPHCPELAAGFQVPRPPAEITDARSGEDVLSGEALILEKTGNDVTDLYRIAAFSALEAAQSNNCEYALMTDGSPSCGVSFLYDGSFSGKKHAGSGITTTLLEQHGIRVFGDTEIEQLNDLLLKTEKQTI